ncbi:NAD(P)/FAD-dependent oxidoreductase [Tessaracoccus antarcticus]|uniref:NAD(P)/FAD-dependent oxidoreductase n=1 Tax=Tessaracoccus antarcticus TaxID=2479848 RepID=A0A3M0GBJ5_9ACTN|nr:NAD(P)/FAD-dependent oxidoreductase [Tessaracoccus antarcticus]
MGVAVIGAGPAGLAVAAELQRAGVPAVVLERSEAIGTSWRNRYDRLRLHTIRWLSGLPGCPIPRSRGRWVARDDVVTYLEDYADIHGIDVRLRTTVTRIDPSASGWILHTAGGDVAARAVVVATGFNDRPVMPDWPGRSGFSGQVLHAGTYRTGAAYAGRDVLVVGAGNSGAEIAVDLVEQGASRVRISVRGAPYVMPRSMLGVPTQLVAILMRHIPTAVADAIAEPVRHAFVPIAELTRRGWRDPGRGLYSRGRAGSIPVLDVGLVGALRAGTVEPVAAVSGFDGPVVLLSDGTSLEPDVVVAATGYTNGLASLVGHLNVLGNDGAPLAGGGGTVPGLPGLYFTGFTNPMSGAMREMGLEAGRIARAVKRDLSRR